MAPDHIATFTRTTRQVGRSRITDHKWFCSCGARTTAPNGFRYANEAQTDWRVHRHNADRAARTAGFQKRL
jgi:hypothetical protein